MEPVACDHPDQPEEQESLNEKHSNSRRQKALRTAYVVGRFGWHVFKAVKQGMQDARMEDKNQERNQFEKPNS